MEIDKNAFERLFSILSICYLLHNKKLEDGLFTRARQNMYYGRLENIPNEF